MSVVSLATTLSRVLSILDVKQPLNAVKVPFVLICTSLFIISSFSHKNRLFVMWERRIFFSENYFITFILFQSCFFFFCMDDMSRNARFLFSTLR